MSGEMQIGRISRGYWYYSNGAYERESRKDGAEQTIRLTRHITGPVPIEDLRVVINGRVNIDPSAPNWQRLVIQRLQAHRFNTKNIQAGKAEGAGVTFGSWLSSFANCKTMGKAACIGGGIIVVILTHSIIATIAPSTAKKLGLAEIMNIVILKYSPQEWQKLRASVFRTYPGSTSLAVTFLSVRLFDELNKTIGPKSFKAWKASKMPTLEQVKSIPEKFEGDCVLQQNVCPITMSSIRVPCRSIYGHVYEEAAIKAWIAQQAANGREECLDPFNNPLSEHLLTIDQDLGDRIELRLALLEAQPEAEEAEVEENDEEDGESGPPEAAPQPAAASSAARQQESAPARGLRRRRENDESEGRDRSAAVRSRTS